MEVFSTSTDSLKKDLEVVKEELIHAKRNRFRDVYYLLRALYSILYNVSSEIDEEAADLILENQDFVENHTVNTYKKISNKYLENFLENKDFHKILSDRIINVYRSKKFNLNYKYEINLTDKEMTDIMLSFLNDEFGNADKFIKLCDEGKILKVDVSKELNVGGYNLFNWLNNNSFILVNKTHRINNIDMMRILMHEFGHVVDNDERATNHSSFENQSYTIKSIYAEVYSMFYEKMFFDYLMKNNIYPEHSKEYFLSFYNDIYEAFNDQGFISTFGDIFLNKKNHNAIEYNLFGNSEESDSQNSYYNFVKDINMISYGGLLGCYFSHLKHKDKERFDYSFKKFSGIRFNYFSPEVFETIGTSTDELVGVMGKELSKVSSKGKRIILE